MSREHPLAPSIFFLPPRRLRKGLARAALFQITQSLERVFKANNGTSKVVNLGAEGEEEVLMEFLGR